MSIPIPNNAMAERRSPWPLSGGEAAVRMHRSTIHCASCIIPGGLDEYEVVWLRLLYMLI